MNPLPRWKRKSNMSVVLGYDATWFEWTTQHVGQCYCDGVSNLKTTQNANLLMNAIVDVDEFNAPTLSIRSVTNHQVPPA